MITPMHVSKKMSRSGFKRRARLPNAKKSARVATTAVTRMRIASHRDENRAATRRRSAKRRGGTPATTLSRASNQCELTFGMAYREIMHMRTPRDTPSKKNCVQKAAADQHYALVLRNRRLSQTEAIGHVPTVLNDPTVRRALVSLQLPGALKAHPDRNRAHTLNLVAGALPSMQRLVSLDLRNNCIQGAAAGKALGDAIAVNTVLKELNLSGQHDMDYTLKLNAAFAKAFAIGLGANRALVKVDISNNDIRAEGCKPLADALKNNQVMTELNISNNKLGWNTNYNADMSGIIAIGDILPTMGALSILNVKGNTLGDKGKRALGEALKQSNVQFVICDEWSVTQETTRLDVSGKRLKPADAIMLGGVIHNNGVLTNLNICDNNIGQLVMPEGWSEVLKSDYSVMEYSHTDGRRQDQHPGKPDGVVALADALKTNRALVKLNLSRCWLRGADAGKAIGDMLATITSLKEIDLSGMGPNGLASSDAEFAKALAVGIGANGALVSVNILNNNIGTEQAQNLATVLKGHATLKSLCGNKGDETQLDMSGKWIGVEGAVMLAPEIVANGALTSLDISNNQLYSTSLEHLAAAFVHNKRLKYLNISQNKLTGTSSHSGEMAGVMALAQAIPTMAALTKLVFGGNTYNSWDNEWITPEPATLEVGMKDADLSNKALGAEGAIIIRAWISAKASSYETITRESLIAFYQKHSPDTQYKVDGIVSLLERGCSLAVLKEQLQRKFPKVTVPKVTMVHQKKGVLRTLDISRNDIAGETLQQIKQVCQVKDIKLTY